MPTGGRGLSASRLLLSALLLTACGGPIPPKAAAPKPVERNTGWLPEQHPECADASELGPLVALGCREGCVARSRPQVVCVDDPPVLLGLLLGEQPPAFVAVADHRGPCAGHRLFRPVDCRTYRNFDYQWVKHPRSGDWCDRATELTPQWGYFEQAPAEDRPYSGGLGRLFCKFEEFVPNE